MMKNWLEKKLKEFCVDISDKEKIFDNCAKREKIIVRFGLINARRCATEEDECHFIRHQEQQHIEA